MLALCRSFMNSIAWEKLSSSTNIRLDLQMPMSLYYEQLATEHENWEDGCSVHLWTASSCAAWG